MAYITQDDIKYYLVNNSDQYNPTDFDTNLLNTLIESVCSFVENYIGTPIEQKSVTSYLTVKQTNKVFLPYQPVQSVTSIANADSTYTYQEMDLNDFILFKDEGLLIYKKGGLNTLDNGLKVDYVAGFDSVPSDLKGVTCELVYLLYQKIRNGTLDASYMSNFRENVAFPQENKILMPHHRKVLDIYKVRLR